jgi:hypothetical protein
MHIYDELKKKYKSTYSSHLRFAIKEEIYPLYIENDDEFYECNNFFKINKENMLTIHHHLKNSYENFQKNKELTYKVENVNISYKGAWGQSQILKADVLKYFYNNEKFDNEFWHIFFENIDDEISKDYIMKKYY